MTTMAPSDQKSKKKKKSKKKANAQTTASGTNTEPSTPIEPQTPNTLDPTAVAASDVSDEEDLEPSAPATANPPTSNHSNGLSVDDKESDDSATRFDALVKDRDALRLEVTQLRQSLEQLQSKHPTSSDQDSNAALDDLTKEHNDLKAETTQLKQSLQDLQSKHGEELESLQNELAESQEARENAEEQYQSLLGKVNTIRSQLGERLKADAEELTQARTRIDELEEQKSQLQEQYTARSAELEELAARNRDADTRAAEQSKELSSLRERLTLSQQNWHKEKNELVDQEAYLREEFEDAKQAMHDWEVLAMEERTIRRDLADRNADLEEQVVSLKEAYEKAAAERETQSNTVDGLQKALHEIQNVRKQELKELVETNQSEQDSLRQQLQQVQSRYDALVTELDQTKKNLERALPFEKEVKEKNLLIGKLRHEAVILNDHLTKALRFLKKGKPEDNVDRQIVTNHLLHFLALDRSDPKKFQILQLIAALLGWTEEQKEQAGLSRPGGGLSTTGSHTGSLRLPTSLVHRTPSTPTLYSAGTPSGGADFFTHTPDSATTKESLAELWQNFLEHEAATGTGAAGSSHSAPKSRTASQSHHGALTSPTRP